MSTVDYSSVTEKDGDWVTPEALSMVYTRYRFALDFCRGKRLLEVACGQAVGLGYLAKHAAQAVGADVTEKLLNRARHTLQETLPLLRLDADSLPLRTASRDVIVCYEAIYYLKHPIQFLQECRRVLSPQGFLLLCTVNPEWPDFNPSPYSRQYYSARQLSALLEKSGFQTQIFGAFPVADSSFLASCVSRIKRVAVALQLIPSSFHGKRLLKRLFLGRLVRFPAAVDDGMTAYAQPVPISCDHPIVGYKILFAVGRPTGPG